jgi:hypothetical protein
MFKKVLSLRKFSIFLLIGAIYYPLQGITSTPSDEIYAATAVGTQVKIVP